MVGEACLVAEVAFLLAGPAWVWVARIRCRRLRLAWAMFRVRQLPSRVCLGLLAVRVVCLVFLPRVLVSIRLRSLVVCLRVLALLLRCRLWARLRLCLGVRVPRHRLLDRWGRRHLRRRCRLVWLHQEHTRQLHR
ncbi:hypothetical protein MFM001_42720 [Mycobacterium sp. MFM001]|nr:hypothetical protein MFM001_42720 [Mycobacterium sp. MFM001]